MNFIFKVLNEWTVLLSYFTPLTMITSCSNPFHYNSNPFINVTEINSHFPHKVTPLIGTEVADLATFKELNICEDWNYPFRSENPGSLYVPEYDSLSTRGLRFYWNPKQSCLQTGNRTRVDCVEVQKANHSASNTYYHSLSINSA